MASTKKTIKDDNYYNVLQYIDEEDDEENIAEPTNHSNDDGSDVSQVFVGETPPNTPAQPPRMTRELRSLQSYNRPGRLETQALYCFLIQDKTIENETPTTFQEAWWYSDQTVRHKWQEAIRLEYR